MQVAVIGTGKTGGEVVGLLPKGRLVGPFNSRNKAIVEELQKADVVIIFVPGSAVNDIIDTVMASGTPAVWGSTGYNWPANLDTQLRENKLKWLKASNFSLGMNIVRKCIEVISNGSGMLDEPAFHIHEVHHIHKKDAPSGTALSWKEWLDRDAEITSERKGDIKGIHNLTVDTSYESISLRHEAHDRAVFAKGALWAAEQLLQEDIGYGFHDLETVFDKLLMKKKSNGS